jgi:hypothetical protein
MRWRLRKDSAFSSDSVSPLISAAEIMFSYIFECSLLACAHRLASVGGAKLQRLEVGRTHCQYNKSSFAVVFTAHTHESTRFSVCEFSGKRLIESSIKPVL